MILYSMQSKMDQSRESYLGIGVCVKAVWNTGVVGQIDIHHSIENDLQQTCAQTSLHSLQAPDTAVRCFAAATLLQSSTVPYHETFSTNSELADVLCNTTGHSHARMPDYWQCC